MADRSSAAKGASAGSNPGGRQGQPPGIDWDLAERIVELLEELRRLDPRAAAALVATRWSCNRTLADHPTIQAGTLDAENGPWVFGLLGLLNGLTGADADGRGAIAARTEDGHLVRFEILERRP